MKAVRDIVISEVEPPVNNVGWLKPLSNGNFMLFFFTKKGWTSVPGWVSVSGESLEELKFLYVQEIPDIITQ